MMRAFLISVAMFAAAPAAAQDWRSAPEYDVLLTTWDIAPAELRLKAGEPVRLRLVNNSNRGLRFAAKDFFDTAQLRQRDGKIVSKGGIDVPSLSTRTIILVPKAGRYKMSGGSFVRRISGMNGTIIVE